MATSLQPVISLKTSGSCEGADFSWLSLKVSRTLSRTPMKTRYWSNSTTRTISTSLYITPRRALLFLFFFFSITPRHTPLVMHIFGSLRHLS